MNREVWTAGALAIALGLAGAAAAAAGPFDAPSPLPFHAPQFDKIKDADYQPAFEDAMRRNLAEVARIADNPAPPTFQNTIVALERSGRMLARVSATFDNINGANTDEALQKIDEIEAPRRTANQDAVLLNTRLFARVKAVWDKRASLRLDPESRQLLKIYYQRFVHAGATLSEPDKARLKTLNGKLSSLETAFTHKILAAAKDGALVVDSRAALAGLTPGEIDAAAAAAKARGLADKWVIPLQNTTQQPSLTEMNDRAARQALFEHGWTRAEKGDSDDTRATVLAIASLRAQKAALLGYPNYAAYVLENQMARTPKTVNAFMAQLLPPTRAKATREAADIQAQMARDGDRFTLEPWDWDHYSEQVRKARFAIDEAAVKPYFELDNVLQNGVFYAAHELYGISFKARPDLPVYQKDVKCFEVIDADGKPLGLMYFDYFKRDNKSGGAWMSSFVGQSRLLGEKPVIYNVANFTPPAPGQPALITFEDVTTMFHEFGHALHGLFANEEYPSLAGTRVARDFVEFPSQFNEHWALDPKVMAHYAKDYRTGAPMPAALIDRIKKAATFNQGYSMGEILGAAELDMQWHTLPAGEDVKDVDAFETAALKRAGADIPNVPPRYRSSYFLHIWANGYAAGYYAYIWTEMLDDDAFAWFEKHGGLTRANGQRFRDLILSRGHTEDYDQMFRAFYGKDPDIGPLLKHRGLTS
jgi:peptidyl-dipeptidase Dcp